MVITTMFPRAGSARDQSPDRYGLTYAPTAMGDRHSIDGKGDPHLVPDSSFQRTYVVASLDLDTSIKTSQTFAIRQANGLCPCRVYDLRLRILGMAKSDVGMVVVATE